MSGARPAASAHGVLSRCSTKTRPATHLPIDRVDDSGLGCRVYRSSVSRIDVTFMKARASDTCPALAAGEAYAAHAHPGRVALGRAHHEVMRVAARARLDVIFPT